MNSELTGRNQGVPDAFSFKEPTFFIYSVPADDNSSYHSEISTYTYPEITHEPCDNGTDSFHFSYFHNGWYNTTIDLTLWEVANKYTIRLYAKDHAGNSITYDHTVKGLFAGVLDFIKDIWNAITSTLSKAWDAVKSAVDWIKDWVIGIVTQMIQSIMDPIMEAFQNWISSFEDIFKRLYYNTAQGKNDRANIYTKTNEGKDSDANSLYWALLIVELLTASAFATLLLALSVAIIATEYLVLAFQFIPGLGQAVTSVTTAISAAITLTKLLFSVVLVITLGTIISALIPEESPLWVTAGIPTLASILATVIIILQEKSVGNGDIYGIMIALAGFFLAYGLNSMPIIGGIVGSILSGIGLYIGLKYPSPADRLPGIGWLDELMAGGCLGFSLGTLALEG